MPFYYTQITTSAQTRWDGKNSWINSTDIVRTGGVHLIKAFIADFLRIEVAVWTYTKRNAQLRNRLQKSSWKKDCTMVGLLSVVVSYILTQTLPATTAHAHKDPCMCPKGWPTAMLKQSTVVLMELVVRTFSFPYREYIGLSLVYLL